MTIPGKVRRLVLRRAGERCEYCGLSQAGQEATFHVDHVIPQAAAGSSEPDNLALACVSCSLRKGAQLMAVDPETRQTVRLFNPRCQQWPEHFRWEGCTVTGLSATGRASVAALKLNRPLILAIRLEEELRGRHPPPECN